MGGGHAILERLGDLAVGYMMPNTPRRDFR